MTQGEGGVIQKMKDTMTVVLEGMWYILIKGINWLKNPNNMDILIILRAPRVPKRYILINGVQPHIK